MKKSSNQTFIIITIIFLLIISCFIYNHYQSGHIMVTSVSTDGQYVITTDLSRQAILWDIKNHKKKILDRKANIYSAYFIKNSHNFMWQHDLNNQVIIKNTNGKIIKRFNPGFATYGQALTSNMQYYIASDEDWALYSGHGGIISKIKIDHGGFLGGQKLQNIFLSSDDKYFLTSGLGGGNEDKKYKLYTGADALEKNYSTNQKISNIEYVLLWNSITGKPVRSYLGNVAKATATLSPDGKYVVAGDENMRGFVWNRKTGKRIEKLWDLEFGKIINPKAPLNQYKWDRTGLIPVPSDFNKYISTGAHDFFTLKFIDKTHYLRFTTDVPNYAILYNITDPKPQKYLKLKGKISVDEYTRNQSIDTSPQAHILVTGKLSGNGILVYKYNPKTKTLKQTWNAT